MSGPVTTPEPLSVQPEPSVEVQPSTKSSRLSRWAPTNKWWAATIPAAGTIVLAFINGDGVNTDNERALVVGIVVQRLAAYVIKNKKPKVVV